MYGEYNNDGSFSKSTYVLIGVRNREKNGHSFLTTGDDQFLCSVRERYQ